MTKTPESFHSIRFQDCDPFNHLNNAKYLDYFINAREDQLINNYGINIFEIIQTQQLAWVVSQSQIAYLSPALTMEKVCIQSQLIQHGPYELVVEMRMWDESKKKLKALLWINFVHFNIATGRAEKHSEYWVNRFQELALPVEEAAFPERVQAMRKQK